MNNKNLKLKSSKIPIRLERLQKNNTSLVFTRALKNSLSYWKKNGCLTEKQYKTMEKAESVILNPETQKIFEEWKNEFLDLKEDFLICCSYYKKNYEMYKNNEIRDFYSIALLAEQGNFIPTKVQFNKIVNNRYAQTFLNEVKRKPKFAEGELVLFKKTTKKTTKRYGLGVMDYNIENIKGIIMKTNSSLPLRAEKGTKRYVVLPFGQQHAVEVEERDIKRAPRRKNEEKSND